MVEAAAGRPAELHVYSPSGEPLRTVKLPGRPSWSQLSASDRWIVVGDVRPPWILVRVADLSLFTFEPKLEPKIEPETSWIAGQTQDGKVLLLLDTHPSFDQGSRSEHVARVEALTSRAASPAPTGPAPAPAP